jgi:hypothetical protein
MKICPTMLFLINYFIYCKSEYVNFWDTLMFQFKVRPTFIGSSEGEISETRMDIHTE